MGDLSSTKVAGASATIPNAPISPTLQILGRRHVRDVLKVGVPESWPRVRGVSTLFSYGLPRYNRLTMQLQQNGELRELGDDEYVR